MPELPEVETTIRGLNILKNKKVTKVNKYTKKLRYNIPHNINKKIKEQKILELKRIGKYILINFKNNYTIIFHLGMSGRLKIFKNRFYKEKHDHLILFFENSYRLVFFDPRK